MHAPVRIHVCLKIIMILSLSLRDCTGLNLKINNPCTVGCTGQIGEQNQRLKELQ